MTTATTPNPSAPITGTPNTNIPNPSAPSTIDPTGFSARARRQNEQLFEAFWDHPSLRGLRDGTLPDEVAVHYVGQDHQYLTAFLRCYGLGIAKSPDRDWVEFFVQQSRYLLDDETHPHHVMCAAAGVSYDEVQVERLAPSAQAYVNHIMESGHDSLGVLLAALMPCPWTYIWAGTRQLTEAPPGPDHRFAGWWEFYGSPESQALLTEFARRLDTLAADAGPSELARMEAAFEQSCHHEVRFWQMAWTRET